jgi:hypothetical protein
MQGRRWARLFEFCLAVYCTCNYAFPARGAHGSISLLPQNANAKLSA